MKLQKDSFSNGLPQLLFNFSFMELGEFKPYIVHLKDRPPLRFNEMKGEALARWWKDSKPSEKVALTDEQGYYKETILSEQIQSIEKRSLQERAPQPHEIQPIYNQSGIPARELVRQALSKS